MNKLGRPILADAVQVAQTKSRKQLRRAKRDRLTMHTGKASLLFMMGYIFAMGLSKLSDLSPGNAVACIALGFSCLSLAYRRWFW